MGRSQDTKNTAARGHVPSVCGATNGTPKTLCILTFLNAKATREFALWAARIHRAHPFERVSKEFLDHLDAEVRNLIIQKVKALPSVGKTIK